MMIYTCWKCGHKYQENSEQFRQSCPKCGALDEDKKKSVRIGKIIGKCMLAIGIIITIFSLWGFSVPNGILLLLGILVSVLGFFVLVFAKPI